MNQRTHESRLLLPRGQGLPVAPRFLATFSLGLLTCFGCDGRADDYSTVVTAEPVGLQGSVAITDFAVDRIAFLTAAAPPGSSSGSARVETTFFETRKGARAPSPSLDRTRLYLLSDGDSPRVNDDDERPALSVFSGEREPSLLGVIELDTAFDKTTEDPEGRWLVLSSPSGAGVSNPNEFTLVDVGEENLGQDEPSIRNLTIRSFGSQPKRFTFTDALDVPGGAPRRFLAVETDFDLTLLDLDNLDRPEVTIQLPKGTSGAISRPAQVAYFAGQEDVDDDGVLAVRFEDSNSVLLVGFREVEGKPFEVTLNLVNLGGIATDLDFVETDAGLRLAALLPTRSEAALIDLGSTVPTSVPLPSTLTTMRVVTQDVFADAERGDVALLWNEQSPQSIAFWSLGETADRAFRSVEGTNVAVAVRRVIDIPGTDFAQRKLLETTSEEFYVLDLATRTSYQMRSDVERGLELSVSRDGTKAVAFAPGNDWFSTIDLGDLHPERIAVERGLLGVFDIEAGNGEGALLAVHGSLGISATLFATAAPDSVQSRHFTGLLLPELPLETEEEE